MELTSCYKPTDWKYDFMTFAVSVFFWAILDGTTTIYFKKLAIKFFPNQTENEKSKKTETEEKETQTTQNSSLHTDQDVRHRITSNSSNGDSTNGKHEKETPVPMTNIQKKFQRSLWKTLNYSMLFIFGSICLYVDCISWLTNLDYFDGWPQPIPTYTYLYYILEIGHYIYSTMIIPWEPKQSDRIQMVSHHVITLVLLSGSYCYLYWRVGVVLLWLTDMSDPFLEIAKLLKYNNKQKGADIFFALFAIVFIITRIFVFPFLIVKPSFLLAWDLPLGRFLNFFLWGLGVIFILWAFIILNIARRVLLGKGATDTREDDD